MWSGLCWTYQAVKKLCFYISQLTRNLKGSWTYVHLLSFHCFLILKDTKNKLRLKMKFSAVQNETASFWSAGAADGRLLCTGLVRAGTEAACPKQHFPRPLCLIVLNAYYNHRMCWYHENRAVRNETMSILFLLSNLESLGDLLGTVNLCFLFVKDMSVCFWFRVAYFVLRPKGVVVWPSPWPLGK